MQIDKEFFVELYSFFFSEEAPQGYEADEIRKQLTAKADKIISHDLYSMYKRTPTGAEREAYRQKYLNHKGMMKGYRTEEEYHAPEPEN